MPRLVQATDDQVCSLYRESHALWGTGLTLTAYGRLWEEIRRLPWAARNARFLVWLDEGGGVLSSLKLYRPLVRVGGRTSRASVLGAVFTPRALRGRGHAATMLRSVVEQARRRGDPIVLLFSDIGSTFYERFGFRALPAQDHWGRIPRRAEALPPGHELRDARETDLPDVRRAHHEGCLRRPLAVIRDEAHWEFLLARTSGFFFHLKDPRLRPRFRVVARRGRFLGYVCAVEGRGVWSVREVGAVQGDPDAMAEVFRAGAWAARAEGQHRFFGWLPPELPPRLAGWRIEVQSRRRALPMVLTLNRSLDLAPLMDPQRAFLPYQDQF